eukprot:TRINITY_DN35318_c0_g1_i1.p1 TRINITY_DN35318_c0_g1~~TRINITY_DN35318_c0_g1_i1.p1  ORF type:complete len:1206 (+),score=373.31 TRINITY_DN35318_c0_g1_i1:97-3714(+)
MIEGPGEAYVTQELEVLKSSGVSSRYRWTISGLVQAAENNAIPSCIYSDVVSADNTPWRFLLFPEGNGVRCLSLYLDLANAHSLPVGWSRTAVFSFTVVSKRSATLSVTNQCEKVFFSNLQDWGFRHFMSLATLHDEERAFFQGDTLVVEATLAVTPPNGTEDAEYVDTPRAGGAVGLCNQGATCYLNSLVQTLFHISYLRNKVFEAPIGDLYDSHSDDDEPPPPTTPGPREKSLVCALQQVFYHLQFQKKAVSTKELTSAFGWTHEDSFRQHDVHELVRVLCSSLEDRWKGTRVAGTLDGLLRGSMVHSITCQDISYESCTDEAFWDLQLNVRGCPSLTSAFEGYFAPEVLDGDNRYSAPGEGLQRAIRKSIIKKAPPVLMLHLKRFDFDLRLQKQTKVNDRQEYPLDLDISKYLQDPQPGDSIYTLMSVLVHSGDVNAGHYYAFVYASALGAWCRFDDERVIRVTERDVMADNFGGEFAGGHATRHPSAYVLTYLRKADLTWLSPQVTYSTVPKGVHRRFGRMSRRELEKDVLDAHLYTQIKVLTDSDIEGALSLQQPSQTLESRRVLRKATLQSLTEGLGLSGHGDEVFLWKWEARRSRTVRPSRLLHCALDTSVEKAFGLPSHHKDVILLFGHKGVAPEDVICGGGRAWGREQFTNSSCLLLFVKTYDASADEAPVVKRRVVAAAGATVAKVYAAVMGADAPPGTAYEEVREGVVERLEMFMPLSELELSHGDVLVFCVKAEYEGVHPFSAGHVTPPAPCGDVADVLKQQVMEASIRFAPIEQTDAASVPLTLPLHMPVRDVHVALAAKLGLDAGAISVHGSCADYSAQPAPLSESLTLFQALHIGWNRVRKQLYYAKQARRGPGSDAASNGADPTVLTPGMQCVEVSWISSVHGELQEVLKVNVPAGATVGYLKAHLIEHSHVLGSESAVGMPVQFEKQRSDTTLRTKSGLSGKATSPPVSMCGAVRRKSAYHSACAQHPYADKVRLFLLSTTLQSVAQMLWDHFEPVPAPQRGTCICVEIVAPDNVLHPTLTSFDFAPGLSKLPAYRSAFNLAANRAPRVVYDRYVVQMLHFQHRNQGDQQGDDDVIPVKAHSIPWLVFLKSGDTVKDLRHRITQERPLYSVLRTLISNPSKTPIYVSPYPGRCFRQPLVETDNVIASLRKALVYDTHATPSLALHRQPTDRLRTNEGREGPGISIRQS